MDLLSTLRERMLIVVTGKGGVGKSLVSAALARLLAARGKRVLLLEVDPRESLHQLFDVPPSGGDVLGLGRGIWLQNLRPQAVLDRLTEDQVRIRAIARRIMKSPVYRHFTEGAPGLKECAVLGHAYLQLRDRRPPARPEVVVLDAPATGHGVSLLAAPGLVSQAIEGGPFGQLSRDLAAFVGDARKTGVVAVTLAEEMPVSEVLDLLAMMRERLNRSPELVAVNGLYPSLPEGAGSSEEEARDAALSEAMRLWRQRRGVNERWLARLREGWSGPLVQLPLLARPPGHALLDALSEQLDAELAAPATAGGGAHAP